MITHVNIINFSLSGRACKGCKASFKREKLLCEHELECEYMELFRDLREAGLGIHSSRKAHDTSQKHDTYTPPINTHTHTFSALSPSKSVVTHTTQEHTHHVHNPYPYTSIHIHTHQNIYMNRIYK